jgi:hypothetical protein
MMKRFVVLLAACCLSLNCFGADDLARGTLSSVTLSSTETKAGLKVERFTFNTQQNGNAKFAAAAQVFVELTDKDGKVAWGTARGGSSAGVVTGGEFAGTSYSGAVRWVFEAQHGDLKRPKVTGYVVEYGYFKGKEFICLDKQTYRTESKEELKERNKTSEKLVVKGTERISTVE